MGKRSSRARRREPVRHPIPASRVGVPGAPRDGVVDLTEQRLVEGWEVQPQIRVRQARAEDVPAVVALSALAGVNLETEITEAVQTGVAGAALRTGLRDGVDGFHRHLAEQFTAHQRDEQQHAPFLHVTLVLVAEHTEQGVVGAAVAYPPIAVIRQILQHSERVGADPRHILLLGAIAITRVKALAVTEGMRGRGIGAALLERCRQIYTHCGYMIMYGQMPATPGLDDFYTRHGFTVLDPGTGFDPWVVFGVHAHILPEADERIFICDQLQEQRTRRPRAPGRRRTGAASKPDRYDPGTLALREAHLVSLLEKASGEVLAVQFPPLLWVKLAEGERANACVDACATLRHTYDQLGIAAELLPVGVVVEGASGARTEYATDQPHWNTDTTFIGHTVLLLPELGKLVDPTIEQIPPVRALGRGPVVAGVPPEALGILRRGGQVVGVPREDLVIGYVPVQPDCRDVLTDAPLLAANAERYRRAGINLATLVLEAFRAPDVIDRIRQAPYPRIHALLDAIGDAPMGPDAAGDMRITLTSDAGGTAEVRLDELPLPAPARNSSSLSRPEASNPAQPRTRWRWPRRRQ